MALEDEVVQLRKEITAALYAVAAEIHTLTSRLYPMPAPQGLGSFEYLEEKRENMQDYFKIRPHFLAVTREKDFVQQRYVATEIVTVEGQDPVENVLFDGLIAFDGQGTKDQGTGEEVVDQLPTFWAVQDSVLRESLNYVDDSDNATEAQVVETSIKDRVGGVAPMGIGAMEQLEETSAEERPVA